MYKFHYDYIKNKFDNNSRILFTYDNSLINEIEPDDLYEDCRSNKEMSDFSNYLTNSKYCDSSNKLVVGKVKDETGGVSIEEVVALKPKIHLL